MQTKQPGDRVGRYVIEAPLGAGGMGEVYEARDTQLGRRVAIKVLQRSADAPGRQRLQREARAAAALEHPNAVVIYDVGEDAGGEMWIAMELVRGRPLRAMVGDASVPVARALRWLVDAARALGAAHRAGLIHRDVKPDNVVVRTDGVAKVLDFGIARMDGSMSPDDLAAISTITAEGALVGTPRYWAPEQLRSEPIDARADQFSWAVTAFELLSGKPPWVADQPVALLSKILTADPPPLLGLEGPVPEEVERVIVRALSKRPDDRYPSIDAAADALEPFAIPRAAAASQGGGGSPLMPTPRAAGSKVDEARAAGPTTTAREALTAPTLLAERAPPAEREGAPVKRDPHRTGHAVAAIGAVCALLIAIALGRNAMRAPASTAPQEPRAPLVVGALKCGDAALEGRGALPELAEAIGVGTCARLAVEAGVDWTPKGGAQDVFVTAKLDGGGAEVTVRIGDRTRTGRGTTPIEAMSDAAAALAKELQPPPMSSEELAAWGAKDAEGARRIKRTWRRMLLDFAPDDQAAARELMETSPESAFTFVIAMFADVGGVEGLDGVRSRVLELVSKLPAGRARIIQLVVANPPLPPPDALKISRQAYAESPDDSFVAVQHALAAIGAGAVEEGFAVLDRTRSRWPPESIWASGRAIEQAPNRDLERNAKYLAHMRALLPETAAWQENVRHAVVTGRIEDARRALALGLNLGLGAASSLMGRFYAERARAIVDLAAFEPEAARAVAMKMLGEPRLLFAKNGADILIAAYILEGRIADADAVKVREIERFRASPEPFRAADFLFSRLRAARWLGRPLPSPDELAWLTTFLNSRPPNDDFAFAIRAELALARAPASTSTKNSPPSSKEAARALAEIEATAAKSASGNRLLLDSILAATVPLVRVARGDDEAAKRFRETDRARHGVRAFVALDAALAMEASGDLAGAEAAYAIAADPLVIEVDTLSAVAARIKLAALYRSQKKDAEATALLASIDRLWVKADPGVRAALEALR